MHIARKARFKTTALELGSLLHYAHCTECTIQNHRAGDYNSKENFVLLSMFIVSDCKNRDKHAVVFAPYHSSYEGLFIAAPYHSLFEGPFIAAHYHSSYEGLLIAAPDHSAYEGPFIAAHYHSSYEGPFIAAP